MLSGARTATGTLTVACTNNDAWSIALSAGGGSGTTLTDRIMTRTGGSEKVHYQLYQNAAMTTPWGDGTAGTSTVAGTGTGLKQSITVYARVPQQTTLTASTYPTQLLRPSRIDRPTRVSEPKHSSPDCKSFHDTRTQIFKNESHLA